MPLSNHQATDSKKNKFTIIDLASADPYLPDRVEYKHTSLLNLRQDTCISVMENLGPRVPNLRLF